MLGVEMDLCGSSGPILLPKQGHLEQIAQDFDPLGFQDIQRRRLHNLSGQPVPVFLRRNFLCFSLCPLPLALLLIITENNLAPSS